MKSPCITHRAAARDPQKRLALRSGEGHRSQRALHGRGPLHGKEAAPRAVVTVHGMEAGPRGHRLRGEVGYRCIEIRKS